MTAAAVVLAIQGPPPAPILRSVVEAASAAGLDEVVVVVAVAALARSVPEGPTVLLDDAVAPDEASAVRVATDWSARSGHGSIVVAYGPLGRSPVGGRPKAWTALAGASGRGGAPVVVGTRKGSRAGLVRLDASVWALLPLAGSLEVLWRAHPELVVELALDADEDEVP